MVHKSPIKVIRFALLLVSALQTLPEVRTSIGIGTGPCSIHSLAPHQANMWSILGRAHNRARHALDRASIVTVEKRHFTFHTPSSTARGATLSSSSSSINIRTPVGSAPPSPDHRPSTAASEDVPGSPSRTRDGNSSSNTRTHLVILDAETYKQTSSMASCIPFTGLPVSKGKSERKRKDPTAASTLIMPSPSPSHAATLLSPGSVMSPSTPSNGLVTDEPLLETSTSFYRLMGVRDSSKNRESRLCGRFTQLSLLDQRIPPAATAFVARNSQHGKAMSSAIVPSSRSSHAHHPNPNGPVTMGVTMIVQGSDGGGKSSLLSLFAHLAHHRIYQDDSARSFGRNTGAGDPTTPANTIPTPASTGHAVAATVNNSFPAEPNTPRKGESKEATNTTSSPRAPPLPVPTIAPRRLLGLGGGQGGLTLVSSSGAPIPMISSPKNALTPIKENGANSPTIRLNSSPSLGLVPSAFSLGSSSMSPPPSQPHTLPSSTLNTQRTCVFSAVLTKPDQFTPWFTIRGLMRSMLENECGINSEFRSHGSTSMTTKFTRYYPFLAPSLHLLNQFIPAHLLRFTPPGSARDHIANSKLGGEHESSSANRLDLILKLLGGFFAVFFEGRRAILLIQNGELMDTSSASAIRVIVSTIPSCMAVISCAPPVTNNDAPTISPLKILERLLPENVTLESLSIEETRSMLMSYLGSLDIPASFVNSVHERTKGHPRSIASFCQMLRKRGFMRDESSGATLSFDVRSVRCHFKLGKPLSMMGLSGAMGAMLPPSLTLQSSLSGSGTTSAMSSSTTTLTTSGMASPIVDGKRPLVQLNPKLANRVTGLAPVNVPGSPSKITLNGLGLGGNKDNSGSSSSMGSGLSITTDFIDTPDGNGITGSQQIILTVLSAIGIRASAAAIAAIHPGNPNEVTAMTPENKAVRDIRDSGGVPTSPLTRVPSSPSSMNRLSGDYGHVTLHGVRNDLNALVTLDLLEEASPDAAAATGTATAAAASVGTPRSSNSSRVTIGLGGPSTPLLSASPSFGDLKGAAGLMAIQSNLSGNGNDRSYIFVQESMREQIYSRISAGWKIRIHERTALFYEKLYKIQVAQSVKNNPHGVNDMDNKLDQSITIEESFLAYHFGQCGSTLSQLQYQLLAARKSASHRLNQQAMDQFGGAIQLYNALVQLHPNEESPTRKQLSIICSLPRLHLQYASVCRHMGFYSRSNASLFLVLSSLGAPLTLFSLPSIESERFRLRLEALARDIASPDPPPDPIVTGGIANTITSEEANRLCMRALRQLAQNCLRTGDLALGMHACVLTLERAARVYSANENHPNRARGLALLSVYCRVHNFSKLAPSFLDRASEHLLGMDGVPPSTRATLCQYQCNNLLATGQLLPALQLMEDMKLTSGASFGSGHKSQRFLLMSHVVLLIILGRFKRATELGNELLALAKIYQDGEVEASISAFRVYLLLIEGRTLEASMLAKEIRVLYRRADRSSALSPLLALLGIRKLVEPHQESKSAPTSNNGNGNAASASHLASPPHSGSRRTTSPNNPSSHSQANIHHHGHHHAIHHHHHTDEMKAHGPSVTSVAGRKQSLEQCIAANRLAEESFANGSAILKSNMLWWDIGPLLGMTDYLLELLSHLNGLSMSWSTIRSLRRASIAKDSPINAPLTIEAPWNPQQITSAIIPVASSTTGDAVVDSLNAFIVTACKQLESMIEVLNFYSSRYPFARVLALIVSGAQSMQRLQYRDALSQWYDALALAKEQQLHHWSGIAHYCIGVHERIHDPSRRRHLLQARSIFASEGSGRYLSLVHTALGQVSIFDLHPGIRQRLGPFTCFSHHLSRLHTSKLASYTMVTSTGMGQSMASFGLGLGLSGMLTRTSSGRKLKQGNVKSPKGSALATAFRARSGSGRLVAGDINNAIANVYSKDPIHHPKLEQKEKATADSVPLPNHPAPDNDDDDSPRGSVNTPLNNAPSTLSAMTPEFGQLRKVIQQLV